MKFIPKQKNKKAHVMTVLLLVTGVACFAASNVKIFKFPALLQVLGALILAFAVYFMLKTLLSYSYNIMPQNSDDTEISTSSLEKKDLEKLAFIVSKRYSGARESHISALDMSTLIAVKELDDSFKMKEVIDKFRPCDVYDYSVTIGRKPVMIIVFAKHGYNKTLLVLEEERALASHLKKVRDVNLATRQDD